MLIMLPRGVPPRELRSTNLFESSRDGAIPGLEMDHNLIVVPQPKTTTPPPPEKRTATDNPASSPTSSSQDWEAQQPQIYCISG
mmetsp:Transcript_3104/g.14579  ORF Transcript_3104/g.14579 Transcript_3104/m.14579 type:complete len:84 (-) Transcript_3104:1523-1774(-)